MNALAIIYVNDYLETIHAEARDARSASLVGRRTFRERLGSALDGLRGILGGDSSGSTIPKLSDYPYGG